MSFHEFPDAAEALVWRRAIRGDIARVLRVSLNLIFVETEKCLQSPTFARASDTIVSSRINSGEATFAS